MVVLCVIVLVATHFAWYTSRTLVGRAIVELPDMQWGDQHRRIGLFLGYDEVGLSFGWSYYESKINPKDPPRPWWPLNFQYNTSEPSVWIEQTPREIYRHLLSWRGYGFGVYDDGRQGQSIRTFELPYWFIIVCASAIGLFAWVMYRRGQYLFRWRRKSRSQSA